MCGNRKPVFSKLSARNWQLLSAGVHGRVTLPDPGYRTVPVMSVFLAQKEVEKRVVTRLQRFRIPKSFLQRCGTAKSAKRRIFESAQKIAFVGGGPQQRDSSEGR